MTVQGDYNYHFSATDSHDSEGDPWHSKLKYDRTTLTYGCHALCTEIQYLSLLDYSGCSFRL